MHVNDSELVKSLQDYEQAKKQQSRFYGSKKDQFEIKSEKKVDNYCFNLYNSIEDIEASLDCFAQVNNSFKCSNFDKYKHSIEKLDDFCNKNKFSFESKFDGQQIKFRNLIKAKLNNEEIDVVTTESDHTNEESENEIESVTEDSFDSTASEYGSDDSEKSYVEVNDDNENLFKYNYYYNYYYMYYYKHFLNSNK